MIRGLERFQEQDPSQLIRDTRTLGQKLVDFFRKPLNSAMVISVFAIAAIFMPALADIIVLIGVFLFMYCLHVGGQAVLPFRMPMRSKAVDYNDMKPGGKKPNIAQGICFFGNELHTSEEIWFNNDDMRTHCLIFGSTGSGKTVSLVGISYNALVQGSGFIYVDGKGDNSLFATIYSMCRRMGREDDLLLINFMTGARDVMGPQDTRLSNTINPFCMGSSSMLTQLVVSLMADSQGGSGDGDMWKNRAIGFVEALMKILVYMRDEGKILLDANTIRNYFHLPKLEQIGLDRMFPRDNQDPVNLQDAPDLVMDAIYNYLLTLPGFDPKKKGKQVSQVLEQHGFITMQLTRVFGSLADTYSHIIRTNIPEVDMKDVVLNRRILVVLLPALEKSPEELSNLGKIIVATLKTMLASGLGDAVEGSYQEVIERKPTNAPTPFLCILDEYGYYAVKGFAVVPAQARSLGFSTIFAGQDLPAFQKASKEEAASIGANTNIKICMKLEDPTDTWEFFQKTAGESYVTKVDSFQTDSQSMMNNYQDAKSASAEKRARVDLLDLKDQGVGQAHIFFKSQIVRVDMFYANPPIAKQMRLNHYLKIEKPMTAKLVEYEKRLQEYAELFKKEKLIAEQPEPSEEIDIVVKVFEENKSLPPIERGIAALLALTKGAVEEDELPAEEERGPDSELSTRLNIFVRVELLPMVAEFVSADYMAEFSDALLIKRHVSDKVELIERMGGKNTTQARNIAWEVVRDMEMATDYPPFIDVDATPSELAAIANKLTAFIEKE